MSGEIPTFESPEFRSVTERTYEQYLDFFDLTEESLKDKTIVDIGAGFSDFVQEVNQRLGTTGARAVGVDPVYTFFNGDFEAFKKSIRQAKLFEDFDYGRFKSSDRARDLDYDWDELERERNKFYGQASEEIKAGGSHVAGSFQELPVQDESVDLALVCNCITNFHDRSIVRRGFEETARILKKDGEARFEPWGGQWDEERQQVYLSFYGTLTDELSEELNQTGRLPDRETLAILQDMERRGVTFYTVLFEGDKNPVGVANLIMRKGDKPPTVNREDSRFIELRKLHFSQAEDDFYIPSETIPPAY